MMWTFSAYHNALLRGEKPEAYTDLREIRLRREYLSKEIDRETREMRELRKRLFGKDKTQGSSRRKFSASGIITMAGGVVDGALLAWKLYKRFKRK